jgi:hypothetical protein
MTLEKAIEISKKYAKHDPFVRLTAEQQKEVNQAHKVLTKQEDSVEFTPDFNEALF